MHKTAILQVDCAVVADSVSEGCKIFPTRPVKATPTATDTAGYASTRGDDQVARARWDFATEGNNFGEYSASLARGTQRIYYSAQPSRRAIDR